jgi:type III secretion system FlhB-like substrate exporter
VTLAFASRRLHFAERCIDGETVAKRRKVPVSDTKQLVPIAVREIPRELYKTIGDRRAYFKHTRQSRQRQYNTIDAVLVRHRKSLSRRMASTGLYAASRLSPSRSTSR